MVKLAGSLDAAKKLIAEICLSGCALGHQRLGTLTRITKGSGTFKRITKAHGADELVRLIPGSGGGIGCIGL